MIEAAFEALRDPDVAWTKLRESNPQGLFWKLAGASALRQIVSELQTRLGPFGVKAWLDEDFRNDCLPRNLILFFKDKTTLIPMKFRDRVAIVGNVPVATAHSSGAALLALAIVEAVHNATKTDNTDKTK